MRSLLYSWQKIKFESRSRVSTRCSVRSSLSLGVAGKMPQAAPLCMRVAVDSQKGAIPLIKKQQTPLEKIICARARTMRARKKRARCVARQRAITRSDLIKNALLAATQEAPIPRRLCEKPDGSMETEMLNACAEHNCACTCKTATCFTPRIRALLMRGGVAVKIKYRRARGAACRLSRAQRSIISSLCETLVRVNASCLAAGQE